MTPAPSVMDYSSRWASKLMTVKRLISNNARRQLVAVGERWESNGVIVYSPPSCSLLFLSLCLPRSYIAPQWNPHLKREKKKNISHVILSFTIHFIWRLTNSIRVILCALQGCCRGERGRAAWEGGTSP